MCNISTFVKHNFHHECSFTNWILCPFHDVKMYNTQISTVDIIFSSASCQVGHQSQLSALPATAAVHCAALVLAKISSQQQFLCIHLSTNLLQLTEPYYYYEHVTSLYVILVLESTLQYPPELTHHILEDLKAFFTLYQTNISDAPPIMITHRRK